MKFSRRQALAAGAIAPITAGAIAPLALTQAVSAQTALPAGTRIFHVFTGPDGLSHIEKLAAPTTRNKPLPVQQVLMTTIEQGTEEMHNAPFKTFTINLTGNIRAEMSDGTHEAIGPGDLVYLEDLTGKGHVTRLLTRTTCLFLRMPADFDLKAWLKG
jgi:hypothetical protein